MFERIARLYQFTLGYAQALSADIPEEAMAEQPLPGVNHPAWILGHLALGSDFGLQILGLPGIQSRTYLSLFGLGTEPVTDRGRYPSKAELLDALGTGHKALIAASLAADIARLDQPHTVDIAFLKQGLPTVGDLLVHLMTTHEATHLGQLSAWRRMRGMPGVLKL